MDDAAGRYAPSIVDDPPYLVPRSQLRRKAVVTGAHRRSVSGGVGHRAVPDGTAGADVEVLWVMLALGVFLGWYIGRWRAENRRARFDQQAVWKNRHRYRSRD